MGLGYLLKCANAGTLTFGEQAASSTVEGRRSLQQQSWADQLNTGDASASLQVTVNVDGATVQQGTLAAFNSVDKVIGVVSSAEAGVFSLSVANPQFAGVGSATPVVTFKFDTGSKIVDLATRYTYIANEITSVTIKDFEPCGACSHYMLIPGNDNPNYLKEGSEYACTPGEVDSTYIHGTTEMKQDGGHCYVEGSDGKIRQCVSVSYGTDANGFSVVTDRKKCFEAPPAASSLSSPPPRPSLATARCT